VDRPEQIDGRVRIGQFPQSGMRLRLGGRGGKEEQGGEQAEMAHEVQESVRVE
jgi:hypothetical protein